METYRIEIGTIDWTPVFPYDIVDGDPVYKFSRWFKCDPTAWDFNREVVGVDYADFAFLRDYGGKTRAIIVSGICASNDRDDLLSELDTFTEFRKQTVAGEIVRECNIFAGDETYLDCYFMEHNSPKIEPSTDPSYHMFYELTFLQFADGTTPVL